MSKKHNILWIDGGYGHLAIVNDGWDVQEVVTNLLQDGHYVRVDTGTREFKQLCRHASFQGSTVVYQGSAKQLARECDARLLKTEAGYKAAVARAKANL